MNLEQLESANKLQEKIKRLEGKIDRLSKSKTIVVSFKGYGETDHLGYDSVTFSGETAKIFIKKHLDWLRFELSNAELQFSKL